MNKIELHLATSEVARNDNKLWYIEFIQKNYCSNKVEQAIIEKVLKKALTQATYKRKVAHIQNTLWLYQPNFDIKEVRQKQEEELHNKYSNWFFDAVARFFKKF